MKSLHLLYDSMREIDSISGCYENQFCDSRWIWCPEQTGKLWLCQWYFIISVSGNMLHYWCAVCEGVSAVILLLDTLESLY